ncbi:MAG: PP0621 family protein [Leptothrix sp. (in: b-proteobacteria)]
MIRLLWWVVLALIGWGVWRNWQRPVRKAGETAVTKAAATAPRQLMVSCCHCGMHLPEQEAVSDAEGRFYCCAAHRDAGVLPQR